MNQFDTDKLAIGSQYHDFKVIGITKHKGETRDYYILECNKCGRHRELPRKSILRKGYNGLIHSIGCVYLEHSPYKKRLRSIWGGMNARTSLKSQPAYQHYKNINVQYDSFIDFFDDQIKAYMEHVKVYGEKNTTIDRIDPYGDYCHNNIRWATMKVQNDNKKKKVYFKAVSPEGEVFYACEQNDFSKAHGLDSPKVNSCIWGNRHTTKGWVFEPVDKETYEHHLRN